MFVCYTFHAVSERSTDMKTRTYLCIDLKSFYASVECVERKLDPMTTNLVVADLSRTEKTICLAITPAMKALGISNRCRIFEIPKHVSTIPTNIKNIHLLIFVLFLNQFKKFFIPNLLPKLQFLTLYLH